MILLSTFKPQGNWSSTESDQDTASSARSLQEGSNDTWESCLRASE